MVSRCLQASVDPTTIRGVWQTNLEMTKGGLSVARPLIGTRSLPETKKSKRFFCASVRLCATWSQRAGGHAGMVSG